MRRCAPAGRRSSAAHNDTPRHADIRPIRVHTKVLARISVPSTVPGIVLRRLTGLKGAAIAASLRDGASATLDPGEPTQRRPGMREQGASRSSPPATGRAKSVPDTTATHGVQRGATETQPVAPRPRARPVIAGQTPFLLRGGSRIRTLEGISRRIYSPLPCGPERENGPLLLRGARYFRAGQCLVVPAPPVVAVVVATVVTAAFMLAAVPVPVVVPVVVATSWERREHFSNSHSWIPFPPRWGTDTPRRPLRGLSLRPRGGFLAAVHSQAISRKGRRWKRWGCADDRPALGFTALGSRCVTVTARTVQSYLPVHYTQVMA